MIELLSEMKRLIPALIPFILLAFFNICINLKKKYRSRQFLMPLFAVLYCGLLLFFQTRINNLIMRVIRSIPSILASAAQKFPGILNGKIAQGLTLAGNKLEHFLQTINPVYLLLFVSTIVFMLAHIILKLIIILILNRIFKNGGSFHDYFVGGFYEKDEEYGLYYLKDHFVYVRTLLKTLYYTSLFLSSALVLFSCALYRNNRLEVPFYPFFGVIILGEFFFFLDGLDRYELREMLTGEEDRARNAGSYVKLRQVLAGFFGDKLGADGTTVDMGMALEDTHEELFAGLEQSDDPMVEAYGLFLRRKTGSGLELDHNYAASGLNLMRGTSVLFNNPFYYDLIPYLFYPMNRYLLRHGKVLVILGRHETEEDIINWCRQGLSNITNVPDMWNVGVLTESDTEPDVGIITRSNVHNFALHEANSDFFEKVVFVVLIEPSRLVTTAQIGLNSIVRHCQKRGKQITYCSADKNCDGLVDALSHILQTNIVEVSATNHHKGVSSYMCWETDEERLQHRLLPNLSRYLGMGTELSFVALKNQVSETEWYGGDAFPVKDMHWIAKQYYYDLMNYAGLPASQEAMDRIFRVSHNLWNVQMEKRHYLTVEDEASNMFEMKRIFANRASEQGFVNIISQDYLLKDYMMDNNALFDADPKAIPYIVSDYALTGRNVILRLCMRMSAAPVSEENIRKELLLIDADVSDVADSLWQQICKQCFGPGNCTTDVDGKWQIVFEDRGRKLIFGSETLQCRRRFSMESRQIENLYFLSDPAFISGLLGDLKNADYIAEDEKGEHQYLGSELRGHIFQKFLPGQFFTFGGKYYEMLRVTGSGQMLVRRAADHINGRLSYRQVRNYFISNLTDSGTMGECVDVNGLRILKQYADIRVETPAYWRMEKYSDFADGQKVILNGVPERTYRNKQILCIQLPKEFQTSEEVLKTIVLLFHEIFKTLFAENQDYLAVLVPGNIEIPITYSLQVENTSQPEPNTFYIVEDSELDIGLLEAVRRNLNRIFGILCDYLDWHMGTLQAEKETTKSPVMEETLESPEKENEEESEQGSEKPAEETAEEPVEESVEEAAGEPVEESMESEPLQKEEVNIPSVMFRRKPYSERFYLLYGGKEIPAWIDVAGTHDLMMKLGLGDNALQQAREGRGIAEQLEEQHVSQLPGKNYCDFCGRELVGTEFEVLADGRERCTQCGKTAVRSEKEFQKIFREVSHNMEAFFGIRITAPVRVEMVNARKLHRCLKKTFVPTKNFDARVIGVAIKNKDGCTLLMENGAPRLQSIMVMAHEMTHIWQYHNWDMKKIQSTYGSEQELEIYEGMAKWSEIQYTYLLGEKTAARREELLTRQREDEYGRGLLRYVEKYPFVVDFNMNSVTPFSDREHPL